MKKIIAICLLFLALSVIYLLDYQVPNIKPMSTPDRIKIDRVQKATGIIIPEETEILAFDADHDSSYNCWVLRSLKSFVIPKEKIRTDIDPYLDITLDMQEEVWKSHGTIRFLNYIKFPLGIYFKKIFNQSWDSVEFSITAYMYETNKGNYILIYYEPGIYNQPN